MIYILITLLTINLCASIKNHYYIGFQKSNLLLLENHIYFVNQDNEIINIDLTNMEFTIAGYIPYAYEKFFYILQINNNIMAISNIGNIYYGSIRNIKKISYLMPPVFFPFLYKENLYGVFNNNILKIFFLKEPQEDIHLNTSSNIIYNTIIYPLIVKDYIIIGGIDGILYIFKNHELVRELFLNRIINKNTCNLQLHSPNIINNIVIVNNYNGDVFGVDINNFNVKWHIQNMYSNLDGCTYKNHVVFFNEDHQLVIVNENGEITTKNINILKNENIYHFNIINDQIFVFSKDKIFIISLIDVTQIQEYEEKNHKYFTPVVEQNKMYFINRKGFLKEISL